MERAERQRQPRRRRSSRWKHPWIRAFIFGSIVVVLTIHLAACAAALFWLPRAMVLHDLRAWSDTWIPAAAGLVIAAALVHFVFFRSSGLFVSLVAAAIAGGWLSAVVAGLLVFPESIGLEYAVGPLAIAIAFAVLAWFAKLRVSASVIAAMVGGVVGVVEIVAQKAPPPSTRPAGGSLAEVTGEPTKDDASSGQVSFPCGKELVRVRPLLTFESRSPDAMWTVLAPPSAFGPRRRFDAFQKEKNGFRARYTDDGDSTLVATRDAKGLTIEAVTRLPKAIYSQINTFTAIYVPFEPTISFSVTGPTRFSIDAEDRSGPPTVFAYLGADLAFHVVRVRRDGDSIQGPDDAEASADARHYSGPHIEMAHGSLGRDEPLSIEIHRKDGAPGGCKLTFADWSSQASTEPSPTFKAEIPQNSIQLLSKGKESTIALTLAASGAGRGFRSVGHAEGTYRNRIRVDTTMTSTAPRSPAPLRTVPPRGH